MHVLNYMWPIDIVLSERESHADLFFMSKICESDHLLNFFMNHFQSSIRVLPYETHSTSVG